MEIINEISCNCGKKHICKIKKVIVENDALEKIGDLIKEYKEVLLVADNNTYEACEGRLEYLKSCNVKFYIFNTKGILIPNEDAIAKIENEITNNTDLIIGVGSGVINDLCKYVSFINKLPYYIVATAPSMDGYASSCAALIINNMKVTYSAQVPTVIIGDTNVLRQAPMDMIKAGFGDIIGKFSSLNDWKLSKVVNEEYFCEYIYNLVKQYLDKIVLLAEKILERDSETIKILMEALVAVGIAMSYAENSRPASGSEHHISHFFEIIGILNNEKYLLHGLDVAYATVLTSKLREKIINIDVPDIKSEFNKKEWKENIEKVFTTSSDDVINLQEKAGWYKKDLSKIYKEKWDEIKKVLQECPKSNDIIEILKKVNLNYEQFINFYGDEKIEIAINNAMYLKDRYTLLWLYNTLK